MSRQRQRAGAEVRGTRQVLFWVSATSLLGRQAGGTAGRRRAGAAVRPPAAQGLQTTYQSYNPRRAENNAHGAHNQL